MNRLALALAAASLAACVAPQSSQPQPRLVAFDPAEYAPYEVEGTGSIEGQAFLKTRGGDVKFGAGEPVFLNPATSYSTEWFERYVIGGVNLEDADPRANKAHRVAVADGNGHFRFDNLPAGNYYALCVISWSAGYMQTGGLAFARVTVADGQTTRVIVTR